MALSLGASLSSFTKPSVGTGLSSPYTPSAGTPKSKGDTPRPTIMAFMMSDRLMTPIRAPGLGSSLPATTINRWTRLILIKEKMDESESFGEHVTTPSKSTERILSASAMVRSRAVWAPFCTSF